MVNPEVIKFFVTLTFDPKSSYVFLKEKMAL